MTIATLLLALLALMATDAAPGTGVATPASASSPAASRVGPGSSESSPSARALLRGWIAGRQTLRLDSVSGLQDGSPSSSEPAVSRQLQLRLAGMAPESPSWQAPLDDQELLTGKPAVGPQGPLFLPARSTTRLSLWSDDGSRGSTVELSSGPSCATRRGDALVTGEQTKSAAQASERADRDD